MKKHRIWAPKPGQVMTIKELEKVGWFAAWELPLPKRPSVELLNMALVELWNSPYPLGDNLDTQQGAEDACEQMDRYAEKAKAIFRAFPAAYRRQKPIPEDPNIEIPF
jgi:hypothetical protein